MEMHKTFGHARLIVLSVTLIFALGCGPGDVIMPEGELTDAQNAAVAAEDSSIEDEESGGMIQDGKKVKK